MQFPSRFQSPLESFCNFRNAILSDRLCDSREICRMISFIRSRHDATNASCRLMILNVFTRACVHTIFVVSIKLTRLTLKSRLNGGRPWAPLWFCCEYDIIASFRCDFWTENFFELFRFVVVVIFLDFTILILCDVDVFIAGSSFLFHSFRINVQTKNLIDISSLCIVWPQSTVTHLHW